ncbi:MAG: pseudouridine synthase, partial [Eubacteriales bacterium]|nr:pseudouridine synthase [Eubacteriales bacterium]
MSGIEKEIEYIITQADDGRLVKHIAKGRMGLSHRQFTSAKFREGGVTLDGRRAIASDVVRAGQRLVVRLREDGSAHAHVDKPVEILYEDEDIFVVNKPAPLPTQSSERQTGDTLEARMLPLLGGRAFRPTNRLDKGTSGLMLAAKHPLAQAQLQKQLHTPSFVREYLAILEGELSPAAGVVDAPIGKADGATVRR